VVICPMSRHATLYDGRLCAEFSPDHRSNLAGRSSVPNFRQAIARIWSDGVRQFCRC
jgi:hypothetical protein